MQERHHVKTTPGEPDAVPEFTPHPVRREEGGNIQMDDINIPLVTVIVAFFAILLAVTIVSLQAWFYNQQTAERESKILPQDDPRTELGAILAKQRQELHEGGFARPAVPVATAPGAATSSQPVAARRIPIDQAMQLVISEYNAGRGGNP